MLGLNLDQCKEPIKIAIDNNITLPINKVDVATAKPISEDVVSYETGLGRLKDIGMAKVGDTIWKRGS